ncbi:DUF1826 domain-containing protein [Aliikangiella coralliicola]|uniref:DUF1826 domain-containing protein n=1 Tax=Aliikangiella coralliicola TaxID=2592383 RepID=A0A545UGK5_9GAMM|nr:DUF1826 domain-containing protein [Aliikangiella coralliicola]TQV88575.1 DUF1826 domain-containing protein [Aliikangiella coralliicola]
MISEILKSRPGNDPFFAPNDVHRRSIQSKEIDVLTDIYQEEINIAVWQRELSDDIKLAVSDFLNANPEFQKAMTVTPQSAYSSLSSSLGKVSYSGLSENIAELVDIFCCLFDLKRAGLRLVVLNKAMCPKFHVDRVPCRLICTYQGEATEWLPHHLVDRKKLGRRADELVDNLSGENKRKLKKLNSGDVALLKGESWQGNENAGLVHRSPSLSGGESRLLLTLDFAG